MSLFWQVVEKWAKYICFHTKFADRQCRESTKFSMLPLCCQLTSEFHTFMHGCFAVSLLPIDHLQFSECYLSDNNLLITLNNLCSFYSWSLPPKYVVLKSILQLRHTFFSVY